MNAPRIVSASTMAAGVARRWREKYWNCDHSLPNGRSTTEVQTLLDSLGESPSPEAVAAVIGNSSWTEVPACSCCEQQVPVVVEVGEVDDYESATAWLCPACLRDAARLVEVLA